MHNSKPGAAGSSPAAQANLGRARNARLNQAKKHADDLMECLTVLRGFSKHEHVDNKDAWQDGRNALEQLTQCFHEANAYNNVLGSAASEVEAQG